MKNKKLSESSKNALLSYSIVIVGFTLVKLLLSMGVLSSSITGLLIPICSYIVMAVSLNLTVGILGELSLGHAGFMSIGAFSGVITATCLSSALTPPLRLAVAILIGAAVAGVLGIIIGIPVLRLKGDYLAIVTLAFGEIISNILNCLYVGLDSKGMHVNILSGAGKLGLESSGRLIINGPVGAAGISKISTFTSGFILILITLFIVQNLVNSRTGRAILAVRDNRISAESVGINITQHKMIAFATSASLAGAAGVLFALNFSTVVPAKFNFNMSILVLVFVVLGGLGKIWGSILAAVVLTVLPEALRSFNNYRMLVYSIVLIVIMLITNSDFVKAVFSRVYFALTKKGGKKLE